MTAQQNPGKLIITMPGLHPRPMESETLKGGGQALGMLFQSPGRFKHPARENQRPDYFLNLKIFLQRSEEWEDRNDLGERSEDLSFSTEVKGVKR